MTDFSAQPLVETEWLAYHLWDANLCIIDARWRGDESSRELYRAGHLPGAVHLDWHLDLSWTNEEGLRDILLPPDRFAAVVGAAGIGEGKQVIAYAETDHSGAARLWWALRYYGFDQVAVLNGGWTKWIAEGRPVTTEIPDPVPAHFTPHLHPELLATADEIQQALAEADPNVKLVDSRPPEQYAGQAVWTPYGSLFLEPDSDVINIGGRRLMRSGHIPGAVSFHASTNLNPADWTYLPPELLREKATALGLDPAQRIITYCGVGISASLGLFALHLAGYKNLALYDASWEEWGTDPSRPIERP